jgi:hypothetical protein
MFFTSERCAASCASGNADNESGNADNESGKADND